MSTGKQLAGLLLLSTALTLPGTAFAQGTGGAPNTGASAPTSPDGDADENLVEDVTGVEETTQDDEQVFEEPDISIPGGGGEIIVVGQRGPRDVTRSSTQVVSILSAEQIARTGEGDIAGALSRVTGLSTVGNGLVYVRGLGDRYSLSLLNGLQLPSPQPLSRVVPLDIFPTNIVASSLVQKTYSANFPGEFGGGVINLTTRAVPDESFLEIGVGISGDTLTTGENGLSYYGGDHDFLGFDDGSRDLPESLQAFFDSGLRLTDTSINQRQLVKDLTDPNFITIQRSRNLQPNFSGSLTAGTGVDVFDDGRFGVIFTAGISNKWRNRLITSQVSFQPDLTLDRDFQDFVTDNRILVNGLLGFGLEIGEHQFRFTNLFIRDTLKQTSLATGELITQGRSVISQETSWFERQLFDTQFVGEMEFGELDFDVRAGYAQTQREAPYEFGFDYVRSNIPGDQLGQLFINNLTNNNGARSTVAFSDLAEDLYSAGVDLSYPVLDSVTATVGYAYNDTSRITLRRDFNISSSQLVGDLSPVGVLQPITLLSDAVIDAFGIGLTEINNGQQQFQADLEVHGAYGKIIATPFERVTIDAGVRYEDADQTVVPVAVFINPINIAASTAISNDYWLPAATVTIEPIDDLQIRFSGAKTIARPQFRELIFSPFTDPETQRQYIGNPALQDSELNNYEVRAEYYFGRGNRASLAGFYKELSDPIEPYLTQSGEGAPVTRFANAPSAELYGAEVEFQYNHDTFDWGGWFETRRIVAVANYTYTQSKLQVDPADTTRTFVPNVGPVLAPADNFFFDGDPLTGQSDHLVNLQLGLEDIDRLSQLTLLLSYASERVTRRGITGPTPQPNVIEDPGLRVDFVIRECVELGGLPLELKFEARNILGRDHLEFQDNGTNRVDLNTYRVGTSFSLSVSTEF